MIVLLQQEYKGIGIRFGAQLIDWIILFIIYFIVGRALFGSFSWQVAGAAAMPVLMVNLAIFFLYFVILEGIFGATLGKRALGLKVIREDGARCGIGPAVIRNILRIIDALPFLYIIGMILISRSPKKQRLGDSVAHTVVVGSASLVTPVPPSGGPPETTRGDVKYCINCGEKIAAEALFCRKCGAKN